MDRFCSNCGTNLVGNEYCPRCGTGSEAAASDPRPPSCLDLASSLDDGEKDLWFGHPDALSAPLAAKSVKWRLTTSRLVVDRGLMGKRNESLQLRSVKEVQVRKSLRQIPRGVGDILISSLDASTPELLLESVPTVDEVAELLREQVRGVHAGVRVRSSEES